MLCPLPGTALRFTAPIKQWLCTKGITRAILNLLEGDRFHHNIQHHQHKSCHILFSIYPNYKGSLLTRSKYFSQNIPSWQTCRKIYLMELQSGGVLWMRYWIYSNIGQTWRYGSMSTYLKIYALYILRFLLFNWSLIMFTWKVALFISFKATSMATGQSGYNKAHQLPESGHDRKH